MTSVGSNVRTVLAFASLGMGLVLAAPAFAAPPSKPPCSTSGPLEVAATVPSLYSYTLGATGSQAFAVTVSSPDVARNGNCDSSLPSVFGNGNGATPTVLPFDVTIGAITENEVAVPGATATALKAALSAFAAAPFQLAPVGTGSQTITFAFTNSPAVPMGTYKVTVDFKPETGAGVGAGHSEFTLEVTEQLLVAVDTLPPTVTIASPVDGDVLKIYDDLDVSFTAIDPPEGGAGTGVTAVRAEITSCSGSFNYDLTPSLSTAPGLPVAADVTATSTTTVSPWLSVGNFTVTAYADDGAGHTGSATATFTAGTNVAPLPPISVPDRQFNTGSTVPVKFTISDAMGALLPPMDGIVVKITSPSGVVDERTAGFGARDVRWELDEYGSVIGYITNYQVPADVGTYQVEILVNDVCGAPASQGSFTFVAAADKGGMQ